MDDGAIDSSELGYITHRKNRGGLLLGIDTGGTYTDAVLLDEGTREVLASAKALTTHGDLSRGITAALDELSIDDARSIGLVGISSTLATNAIAEGKLRTVALLLIGYDPELVSSYSLDASFHASDVAYVAGGHTSQGEEQAPLDVAGIEAWVRELIDKVDAIAISSYFSPLDSSHEERALEVVRSLCSIPVVLGHQLSTRLDSIKRAATACLNASLVSVMQEFLDAVRTSLDARRIRAPLMVLKGDGSLATYEEAVRRPVETVLSGPAASVIGGHALTDRDRALVVDVGGTTTDIALLDEGRTSVCDDGVRVGDIETAVRAADVRTVCIGCDSSIGIEEAGVISIGPDRVTPLCRLASSSPKVERQLIELGARAPSSLAMNDLEYWILQREPPKRWRAAARETATRVVDRLRTGPARLSDLLDEMGAVLPLQLGVDELLARRVIERASVTPTDCLHASGQLDLWSRAAASHAVAAFCAVHGLDDRTFAERAVARTVEGMIEEVLVFLAMAEGHGPVPSTLREEGWGRWFLERLVGGSGSGGFLEVSVTSRGLPLIGVGAPAGLLVRRVAAALGMPFLFPRWSPVANAVGAVAGSVVVAREAIVYRQESERATRYVVHAGGVRQAFKTVDESLRYAEQRAVEMVLDEASKVDAVVPDVSVKVIVDGSIRRVEACAVSSPELLVEPPPLEEPEGVLGVA